MNNLGEGTMVNEKRILTALLVALVVLIIVVSLGVNAFLFLKCVELKEMTERQRSEHTQLEFNRGKYIDLKVTIEEQRKDIMQLEERNERCLQKFEKALDDLENCKDSSDLEEKDLNGS